ncbi:MAG TPA: hypothetical protein VHF47_02550 [Acidimicrobiales bacterium]|nr:hypothetical protein [Acidimicrobiales bacterium]
MRPSAGHLVRRFFGMLVPVGPSTEGEAFAVAVLSEAELALWRRMTAPDRRHAVAVAKRVEAALGAQATPPVLAAALLHDVGKVEAGLGPAGRVLATLAGMAGRHELTPRVATYLRHAELGAGLLELAGSDPLTVAWAREHHLPPEEWTVPAALGTALKSADDD